MSETQQPTNSDPRFEPNRFAAVRAFVIYVIAGALLGVLCGVIGRSIGGDIGTVVRVAGVVLLAPVVFFLLTSILIGLNIRLGWSPLQRQPLAIYFLSVAVPAVLAAINV
ncbi:hypothetical protein FBR02_01505 [Anaerolineae bacterium CFX9]|nr:hypothetical protein [Oscillatoria laete-virens]MDK3158890.1 hypothetical protein [Kamptonema cortianum]MDL1899425.1 hypothetical protein [Anaerolineae bacterium CFX9]MDL5052874.1 hypothetical protein [Oscillatoria laete-virens NRMC-F 0139]